MTSYDMAAPGIPAYRDLNVLRWLAAYTASVMGDVVYFLVLSWSATRATGPSQAGLVIAAGALPRAVLMLGGGVLADRFGPHRVAVASDATRCVVILAAAVSVVLMPPSLWLLVPVALVFGVVDAVFMPAVGALPPRITAPEQLARVQGMRGLSIRLSNAVGPLLAGVALAAGGAAGAFATAGTLFALSLAVLLTVRVSALPPTDRRAAGRAELRDGLRYVRRHRVLAPLVTVIGLSEMCFSGPVAAGLVLLADERGWGAAGMGWIASAFSVGAAVAALLLTVRARVPRAGPVLSGALCVTAAGAVALGHAPALPSAVAFGGLIGLANGITATVTGALVQTETDPRYLGRVTSVTTLCSLGLAPVLFPLVGVTVAVWGAAMFFTVCGGICLVAALFSVSAPALRRAELHGPGTERPPER
ncbi:MULTISPECIES: MFS transporter [Streptomyces]|uniref:MFS transporter n=1 Tax=Streptomyces violaceoruber TaxID=1935 RepID=A0A1V0UDD7_STRVN|nr:MULTISPECIES: MFS transporter [Streptomyces]ARF63244.1 MFS transporter [Streptomyces violaceoruber]KOG82064.1 MFS transporter [Streptomyces griseus subsp. rhodochrous]KOU50912.1 MFS transporter [Streptomyces sp. MMG1522]